MALTQVQPGMMQQLTSAVMPAGSVIQTVNYTNTTEVQTASSTFTDTGQTITFTPTSATSKILILWTVAGCFKNSSNTYMRLKLVRNSTDLAQIEGAVGYSNDNAENNVGASSISYLDSPATTSPVTYKIQYLSSAGSNYVGINRNQATSSATLLEIKQ